MAASILGGWLVWTLLVQVTCVPLIVGAMGWGAGQDLPIPRRVGFAAGFWLATSLMLGLLLALVI